MVSLFHLLCVRARVCVCVCVCVCLVAHLCLTLYGPWTVALQLLCPWDFPDKNTGAGGHFLVQGIFPAQGSNLRLISCIVGRFFTTSATWEALSESRSVVSNTAAPHSPLNSPGQDTAVGSLSLFQQIFPTQESNQGFLHCRRILYQLRYQGSPTPDIFSTYLPSSPFKV